MPTADPALLDRLTRSAPDPDRLVLLRGGTVVTMDAGRGVLDGGDVLLRGAHVVEVGHRVDASAATVVDVTGSIVAPGMVDTHRHAWQAQMRRTIPDVEDLAGYVRSTLVDVAPAYAPQDVYVGTLLAALTALDGGITTMLDFSHNARTADHADAAITALIDSGIRGVHASMAPHFGPRDGRWPTDLARLRSTYAPDDDRLVTLRLAALATGDIAPHVAYGPRLAAVAAELDIGVSVDAVLGPGASHAIADWQRRGLLGPHLEAIHCTALSADAWAAMRDHGVTVSLAPTSDAQIGLEDGVPPVDEALAHGIRPGLSVDVEVALASDMFTQMRALLSIQRMRAVHAVYGTHASTAARITTRDVLDLATLSGARTLRLDERTGSITPGKQADLVVVDAEAINTMPLHDPVATLVLGADRSNVTSVWVAGQVRKWDGALVGVDVDALRRQVHASVAAIAERRRATGTPT